VQRKQVVNLTAVKASRDLPRVETSLAQVRRAAESNSNLMPPIIEAAKAYATEQEICDVLRASLGTYTDPAEF
jgi:methylmalonyl-CoA mutase N-terminal domain/subunit